MRLPGRCLQVIGTPHMNRHGKVEIGGGSHLVESDTQCFEKCLLSQLGNIDNSPE